MTKYLFIFFLLCSLTGFAQDDNIMDILMKRNEGKALSESEKKIIEEWEQELRKLNLDIPLNEGKQTVKTPTSFTPPPLLTNTTYSALCKTLLQEYGEKVGESLPKLELLLLSTTKASDGADMGAGMLMQGAASSSVYCIAFSAFKEPKDPLSANNLGAALLQTGDYTRALQVLLYANNLRPNVGLILTNLGWVYRELGSVDNAKKQFNKALSVAEEMSSPYLGLGLIAEKEGNTTQARIFLRKALKDQYSEVGMVAYKESKTENSSSPEEPLSDEKGSSEGLIIPELPSSESVDVMASKAESLKSYNIKLEQNVTVLAKKFKRQLAQIKRREEELSHQEGDFVLIPRDFSREKMILDDIAEKTFGENSRFNRAKKTADIYNSNSPAASEEYMNQYCKDMEDAIKRSDELKLCLLMKQNLQLSYEVGGRYYPEMLRGNREDIMDYYALTDPILERIYEPEYNELYNTQRELIALWHHQILTQYGMGLAQFAVEINKLDCNKSSKSLAQGGSIEQENLPAKRARDCPLGPKGIKAGMGVLAIELSCTHVKLSGGEGILWSVSRDFVSRETKIWGGIGAKAEYGRGVLSGEASVGVETTFGEGYQVKDVAFTSSVKAGVGGLLESEISGRFAIEGGPSIETNAGFVQPSLPINW
ncbi:MAG: tetratricopeptide repeat protein [Dysgonamonadaceae bacterium]